MKKTEFLKAAQAIIKYGKLIAKDLAKIIKIIAKLVIGAAIWIAVMKYIPELGDMAPGFKGLVEIIWTGFGKICEWVIPLAPIY